MSLFAFVGVAEVVAVLQFARFLSARRAFAGALICFALFLAAAALTIRAARRNGPASLRLQVYMLMVVVIASSVSAAAIWRAIRAYQLIAMGS